MPRPPVFLRLACFLSALSSTVFFGLGAFLLGQTREGDAYGGTLRIDAPIRPRCDMRAGMEIAVAFRVTNMSLRPINLLGVDGLCTPCWPDPVLAALNETEFPLRTLWVPTSGKPGSMPSVCGDGFPFRVSPGSSKEVSLRLRARSTGYTGAFAGECILYSDAPGCERLPLRITGTVVPIAKL
jgi:hypothetical protein